MTEDLQLMRDDIVDSAYEELVAQVNAMIDVAILQERERCAAICDDITQAYRTSVDSSIWLTVSGKLLHEGMYGGARDCAEAIRKPGENE